jgi:hypothetical protein
LDEQLTRRRLLNFIRIIIGAFLKTPVGGFSSAAVAAFEPPYWLIIVLANILGSFVNSFEISKTF